MSKKSITTVETLTTSGAYDMTRTMIIIDHSEYGRILLAEEFNGMCALHGGAYRWGSAHQLQDSDTFETMQQDEWNESTSLLDAVLYGGDPGRPALGWSYCAVRALAKSANRI